MIAAFLVPGFSQDKTFTDSSLDVLKREMSARDVLLNGVVDGWSGHNVRHFGQCAVEQSRTCKYDGILIGHSLGALAILSVVDSIPMRHLVLCSPSALFSEDIDTNLSPAISRRLGVKRVEELKAFSAAEAASSVSRLGISTTVLFGEKERKIYPHLVARSEQLAATIAGAELVEVAGAAHSIGENPYARELARIVSNIAINPQLGADG